MKETEKKEQQIKFKKENWKTRREGKEKCKRK
jgi:hypothetical protein